MKKSFLLIVVLHYMTILTCFVLAGFLAYHNIKGWGWALFIGFIVLALGNSPEEYIEDEGEDNNPS